MWDGNGQKFKVIDGQGQAQDLYGCTVNISNGTIFNEMYTWYLQKKTEEAELDKLCKVYPNLDEARKEFAVLHRLVKENK
jgi:hypothetical protein